MPSPKGAKHLFPRNKGRKNSFAGAQEDKKPGLLQLLQQPQLSFLWRSACAAFAGLALAGSIVAVRLRRRRQE